MAVIEHNFEIRFRDVSQNNKLTNRALLEILEDVAGMHSDLVGYGLNDIPNTGFTWILLNWKVKIFKRPIYGETILAKTWGRDSTKFYTYRDFEVYDKNNNLLAIATTKWALIDCKKMGLAKLAEEIISKYQLETKKVFENEPEPNKLPIPEEIISSTDYIVKRKDIDINHHVNNISYLDIAYEILPEHVYENVLLDSFEIMYKKESKLGETIKCLYSKIDNSHYIVMKSEDEKFIHCIVKLDEKE